ncbi:hypothetical protein FQN54_008318 [Arachnomyces sp. PD_36]|nr:hypothetical protein FQN54_008318 [Arachnomyces sp. PD_36]
MEPGGIYLILSASTVEYHWEIYVASTPTKGIAHHANNSEGGWRYERRLTDELVNSEMLALALKVGTVPSPDVHARIDNILGDPSMISQDEGFRCRKWALDGVERLRDAGIVDVPYIEVVMDRAYELADGNRSNIELGMGGYVVASM